MVDIIKSAEANDGKTQDALWQRQQVKSFTAWVNSHLGKARLKVEDIGGEFKDGIKLMKLVEIISGDTLPAPEKGKMKLHKIQNINKALDHIAAFLGLAVYKTVSIVRPPTCFACTLCLYFNNLAKGVKLAGISSEEIYDSNLKMILGMIWILILKFQINDISVEEMSARDGLLLWCQKKTAGYNNCNVQNFHTSWQNGNAFCALIHRHRPDLIDYNNLPESPKDRLNLAFKVAEESLDIPQMLDADDMVSSTRPDERSVMTYVAAYYHCFAGSNRTELAARRLENLLSLEKQIAGMKNDYETRYSELLKWILEKEVILCDSELIHSMIALKDAFQCFSTYKNDEKPPKAQEKIDLEAHYSSLQTLLRVNNRPAYHPKEGRLISDIHKAWNGLSSSEKKRTKFLNKQRDRLEKLERLARRFETKSTIHSKWAEGKKSHTHSEIKANDVGSVLELIKQHDAVLADIDAHSERVRNLKEIAHELQVGGYEHSAEINKSYDAIAKDWKDLEQSNQERRNRLEEALAIQQKHDELRLRFAKLAFAFCSWCETMYEDLMEDVTSNSMEDVAELEKAFIELKQKISEKTSSYEDIMKLGSEMAALGIEKNNYTPLTTDSASTSWNEINEITIMYNEKLAKEKARQNDCESLRLRFAEPANKIANRMQDITTRIAILSTGSLESQLTTMSAYTTEVETCKPELETCNELSKLLNEASIFQNSHALYTMSELSQMYDQLNAIVRKNTTTIENQILLRDKSGISEEQMSEYKDAFNHFSHNKKGVLDKNEFRSAILAVGYDLGEGDCKFDAVWNDTGISDGGVTFESFINLLTKDQTDEGSITQLLDSFKTIAGDKEYVTEADIRRELKQNLADYAISILEPFPGVADGLDYKKLSESFFTS